MASMANPFYLDMGFSLSEIASITKLFGFFLTITGSCTWRHPGDALWHYADSVKWRLAGILTNLLFAWLSQIGHDMTMLAVVIGADSLAGGIAASSIYRLLIQFDQHSLHSHPVRPV